MKILILGAKGSLGQTFLALYKDPTSLGLRRAGQEIFAWDREELDITDEKLIIERITELAPELIINCAAYNAVDKAEEERELAEAINGYAVGFIAKVANKIGATMVHFSSNYVFDGTNQQGYNEDDAPSPKSAYAKSKFLGETELAENTDKFYLIRTAWLYGKAGVKPSFVEIMLKLANQGKEITAIDDEFASPTFVVDLAQATRALIEERKPFGVYHLTNSGEASWCEWAKEIFTIKGITANLTAIKRDEFSRLAARPQYGILNNTKFIELRPWTEAFREYLS
jgi:dTDP-4-dehydrorhamnose reductase